MAHDLAHAQRRGDGGGPQRETPATGPRRRLNVFAGVVRRHWIALTVVAVLVLLYTVGGFYLAPRLARTMAQDYVARELGRHLLIREVRFNPFTFEAVVDDLDLREADDAPILSFKSLRVNAQLTSIWKRGIVLKDVRLDDPVVRLVIRHDGSLNLAQLVPASPQAPAQEPQSPPRAFIGTLAINNGRVDLEDRTQAAPFTAVIGKIRFGLSDFRMDLDYKNAFAFSATSSDDEQFEWSGNFTVQPFGSAGHFVIRNLRGETVDEYLQERLPFRLASGTASLAGDYQVSLKPKLTLDVTVPSIALRDLQLKERTAAAHDAPVALPQVDVSELAFSYARRELAIKQVSATGAHVEVRREPDGSINLERLVAGGKSVGTPVQPASAAQATDGAAFNIRIDAIRLSESAASFEDHTVAPAVRVELKPVALTVNGWSTDPAATLGIEGDVAINEKGRLQWKGQAQLEPLAAELDLTLRDFALPFLQPYLAQFTTVTLHSARLGATGKVSYALAANAEPAIKFSGTVDVADLRTTVPPENAEILKWKNLNVAAIDFSSAPGKLTIDRLTFTQPYARVVIAKDRTLNVAKILPARPETRPGTVQPKKANASPRAFPVRINHVRVLDGSANFADYSIEPSFATGVVALNGTVNGLSSDPGSRAKVMLEGKVDKYAPVDISGEVNLLAATMYTDIAMNFHNIELATFNPYSGKFAGYSINKGKLTTELRYKVENRTLVAEHHIVLDNLVFGDKTDSKDAAPIPIKLAVALLKDRRGIIDIQLPVRGSLDDPQFRLGPIIWKAALGLLTKIVTAPFAALGALFGGGAELSYVDFPAGASALPASELGKLEKLATALVERPQLRLDVPQTSVGAQDSEALARAAFQQRVPPATTTGVDAAAKGKRLAQLEAVYRQIAKVAAEYPPETRTASGVDLDARLRWIEAALVDKLKPDQTALDALAKERAQAVQDVLLAHKEIDPERIFITNDRKASTTPEGTVRMELKLE
jgi:uncharacterized protein involved in outer membrane biogenesis